MRFLAAFAMTTLLAPSTLATSMLNAERGRWPPVPSGGRGEAD